MAALRQGEGSTPVVEACRKLGITEQTFYRWKRKFASMGVAELRRLRQVEEENCRLKRLVADLTLDKQMLQEALRKNWQSRPSSVRWGRSAKRLSIKWDNKMGQQCFAAQTYAKSRQ
jgi:putative transposase